MGVLVIPLILADRDYKQDVLFAPASERLDEPFHDGVLENIADCARSIRFALATRTRKLVQDEDHRTIVFANQFGLLLPPLGFSGRGTILPDLRGNLDQRCQK
jgi:hypothetical protein